MLNEALGEAIDLVRQSHLDDVVVFAVVGDTCRQRLRRPPYE